MSSQSLEVGSKIRIKRILHVSGSLKDIPIGTIGEVKTVGDSGIVAEFQGEHRKVEFTLYSSEYDVV